MTRCILTQEELKNHLHYDPLTGIFKRILNGFGKQAGAKNSKGYIIISINNVRYQAHRLAWLYVYGENPENCIDHINLVKDDNRIVNLRKATTNQNQHNRTLNKNNKTGVKGVCYLPLRNKWRARCGVDGVLHNLGDFKSLEQASKAYEKFARKHHKEYFKN